MVIYRVDGVSGRNVFTGIKITLPSPSLEQPDHQSCAQPGRQLSACRLSAVLTGFPERRADYINRILVCNKFFPFFEDIFLALEINAPTALGNDSPGLLKAGNANSANEG